MQSRIQERCFSHKISVAHFHIDRSLLRYRDFNKSVDEK